MDVKDTIDAIRPPDFDAGFLSDPCHMLFDDGETMHTSDKVSLVGVCGCWSGVVPCLAIPFVISRRLELDRDRTARALSLEEVRQRLRVLDADPVAQHHDLPEGHQPTFRGSRLPTPQYEFGDAEQ